MQETDVVEGVVAPGFDAVREIFEDSLTEMGQGGAAFAAVIERELVVDLWAGSAGDQPWKADTRAVLMSTTKSLATVVAALLVDQGILDVERPVASYWPAFAAGGKQDITVAQVLAHSAGLITVPGYQEFMTPEGDGWDRTDEILRRLETAEPAWEPGSKLGYHGLTFAWLLDEIVRRATGGSSIGTILRRHVTEPLGLDGEMDLGTPAQAIDHVARVTVAPTAPDAPPVVATAMTNAMLLAVDGRTLLDVAETFFNDPKLLKIEFAGSNATATARAVARLHGELVASDRRLISGETMARFTAEEIAGEDQVGGGTVRRGLGFELSPPREALDPVFSFGPSSDAFGHGGAGGQIGLADPSRHMGIGFVRSELSGTSALGARLVDTFFECV